MHFAWQIAEIRYLIFEYLEPQDFARLAQTNKALFEVATDELWRTITSVSAFLACLPQNYRYRPLQAQDIQRLDCYSSKVRHVVLAGHLEGPKVMVPPEFKGKKGKTPNVPGKSWHYLWKEITELRPTVDFLPNLRRVRIENAFDEVCAPLVGISGLELTGLYIKGIMCNVSNENESAVLQMLRHLQNTPKLEYLFVRKWETDPAVLKLIQQSPLNHLRFDPPLSKGFHKAFEIPYDIYEKSTLEKLTLSLTGEWCGPKFLGSERKYFPALKALRLNLAMFIHEGRFWFSAEQAVNYNWTCKERCDRHPNRQSPTLFLQKLANPQLKLLHIKFSPETTGKMFLEVISAVVTYCNLANLEDLALAGGGHLPYRGFNWEEPEPERTLLIKPTHVREALKILLPMKRLKHLRLSVLPNFLDGLDLDLYQDFADGLPELETLRFGHTEFKEEVSLHQFGHFGVMLPKLRNVNVGRQDGFTHVFRGLEGQRVVVEL